MQGPNTRAETRLRDGLNTDPDNVQMKKRMLQVEVPKDWRIKEVYDICLS